MQKIAASLGTCSPLQSLGVSKVTQLGTNKQQGRPRSEIIQRHRNSYLEEVSPVTASPDHIQPSRQLGGQGLPLLTHSTTDSLVQEDTGGRWLEGRARLAAQQVKAHTASRSQPCPGFRLPAQMGITAIVRAGVPVFQSPLLGAPPDHPPPPFSAVAGVIRTRLCCTHHSHLRVLSRHKPDTWALPHTSLSNCSVCSDISSQFDFLSYKVHFSNDLI